MSCKVILRFVHRTLLVFMCRFQIACADPGLAGMIIYYMLDSNSGPVDALLTLSSDYKLNGRMVQPDWKTDRSHY